MKKLFTFCMAVFFVLTFYNISIGSEIGLEIGSAIGSEKQKSAWYIGLGFEINLESQEKEYYDEDFFDETAGGSVILLG